MWNARKVWITLVVSVAMLVVLVGCDNERENTKIEPTELSLPLVIDAEQEPEIIPINYVSYEQSYRLVKQDLDLLVWPQTDAALTNQISPGTLVSIQYAATLLDDERWLFVTIPTYDCPCNNQGWVREADTEEITEANRLAANNGISIYLGTQVYDGFEFDPLVPGEPTIIDFNMRGRISEVREDYARITTGGGREFWMKKEDIGFPTPHIYKSNSDNYQRNIDSLLEAFASVHDTGVGIAYDAEELIALAENPFRTTYETTLEYFVGSMLHKEIESYRTISDTVNPRTLLVIMRDDSIYKVTLEHRYEPKPFWVVTGYMDFYENGNALMKQQYEQKAVKDVPEAPRLWAEKLLQAEGWVADHLSSGGKTYILIKSSMAELDAVELDHIELDAREVTVGYQLLKQRRIELVQDYLLLEADFGEVIAVNFEETFSGVE